MNRIYLILILLLIRAAGFSQDSLKKTFLSVQFGGLKQINIDNNERSYYGYWAGTHIGFKTRKHLLVQTGLEYYRVSFYASSMNSGPGTSDNGNAFRFNKFCIPIYFNYISAKNNFIIGGGPVIDLVRNYMRSYIREQADPNTQTWSQQPMSETITDFSPLYLSAAAKVDYKISLGARLSFLIGLKFKFAIYNEMFYTDKGNTNVKFRDVNSSLNIGLVF